MESAAGLFWFLTSSCVRLVNEVTWVGILITFQYNDYRHNKQMLLFTAIFVHIVDLMGQVTSNGNTVK